MKKSTISIMTLLIAALAMFISCNNSDDRPTLTGDNNINRPKSIEEIANEIYVPVEHLKTLGSDEIRALRVTWLLDHYTYLDGFDYRIEISSSQAAEFGITKEEYDRYLDLRHEYTEIYHQLEKEDVIIITFDPQKSIIQRKAQFKKTNHKDLQNPDLSRAGSDEKGVLIAGHTSDAYQSNVSIRRLTNKFFLELQIGTNLFRTFNFGIEISIDGRSKGYSAPINSHDYQHEWAIELPGYDNYFIGLKLAAPFPTTCRWTQVAYTKLKDVRPAP